MGRFPCPLSAAAAAAVGDRVTGPDAIRSIEIGVCDRVCRQNNNAAPNDVMSAQYSVQYAVAAALLGRAADPLLYLRPTPAQRSEIDALLGRTRVIVDESAEAAYPQASEARVTVDYADGSRRSAYRGAPSQRDPRAWRAKLGSTGDKVLDDAGCDELEQSVQALAEGGSTAACLDAMAKEQ